MTLTFYLESYLTISSRRPCVRNIDSPRSKRCIGESISLRRTEQTLRERN